MADRDQINLLVLPDLFPKEDTDLTGIFVVDYLRSVQDTCNITVLYSRLRGNKKGSYSELFRNAFKLTRYVYRTKAPSLLKPLLYLAWLYRSYQIGKQSDKPDIIHAHGIILNGTLAWLLGRYYKVPVVISDHTGPFSKISGHWLKRLWARFVLSRADIVLTVSDHLQKEMLDAGMQPKKIMTTYNPVDTELFKPPVAPVENRRFFFAGRLEDYKGARKVLEAFHRIIPNHPGWTLEIAGDGPEKPGLEQYISNHGLEEIVKLLGPVDRKDIAEAFLRTSCFVFPSEHESFGLVIAEAMSAGLPVIAPDCTAPPEYVTDQCGYLVNPDDTVAIADAMQRMIENHQGFDRMAIRKYVTDRFGISGFGTRLHGIYMGLLKENPPTTIN